MSTECLSMIRDRLQRSEYWIQGKSKENGRYLSGLLCPACGHPEAYAYIASPWVLCCNRLANCSRPKTPIRELFPDLYCGIEPSYPAVENDPHRPARVYLQTRGLSAALDKLTFEYWPNVRKTGAGAVMFWCGCNLKDRDVWNGRIIAPPEGVDKSHSRGETAGVYWSHHALKVDETREVFITEGVIDALTLIELGQQAIAVLSASVDPRKFELPPFQQVTLAFDADAAGRAALKRWKAHLPKARAVMPPGKMKDWNDWFVSVGKDLQKARAKFEEKRPEMEWRGKLALADSPKKYVEAWLSYRKSGPGLFTFGKEMFWGGKKIRKDGEVEIFAHKAGNFKLEVDHYQLSRTNPDEPVHRYHLRIQPKAGAPVACTATADELASPHGLRKLFLERGKVLWSGDGEASTALIDRIVSAQNAPTVRQLQVLGFDEGSRFYVFPSFAVTPEGAMVKPSDRGFYRASSEYLRPMRYRSITPETGGKSPKEIFQLLNASWPDRAAVAVAFLVATWFLPAVRGRLGFFPFLSFWGKPQTGKSRLVRLLNCLQALDEEGVPLNKVNTSKGEVRKLAQFHSLMKGLLEARNQDKVKFDFDQLLTLYNGNPLQVRAATTNDLQSLEIQFNAGLLFAQNDEPFTSRAQKERVISLEFRLDCLDGETTKAYETLLRVTPGELAYFFPAIMKHRRKIEAEWYDQYQSHRLALLDWVKNARIAENHAIISAFLCLLDEILDCDLDHIFGRGSFIEKMAQKKLAVCEEKPISHADLFLETLEQLPTNDAFVRYVDKKKESGETLTVVNLPGLLKVLVKENFRVESRLTDLQESLKLHPAYRWHGKAHRFGNPGEQLRAWAFYLPDLPANDCTAHT